MSTDISIHSRFLVSEQCCSEHSWMCLLVHMGKRSFFMYIQELLGTWTLYLTGNHQTGFWKHFVCFPFPAVLLKFSLLFVPNNTRVSGTLCSLRRASFLHPLLCSQRLSRMDFTSQAPRPSGVWFSPTKLNTGKRSEGRQRLRPLILLDVDDSFSPWFAHYPACFPYLPPTPLWRIPLQNDLPHPLNWVSHLSPRRTPTNRARYSLAF